MAFDSPVGEPLLVDDLMTGYGRSREPMIKEVPEASVITKARCLFIGMLSFVTKVSEVTTLRPLLSYSSIVSHEGEPKKRIGTISVKMPTGVPDECLRTILG